MQQRTFGAVNFEKYGRQTRKAKFLEEMNGVIPWEELVEAVEPYYPQPSGAGRRPVGIERMLRIHFLQHWFSLSDTHDLPINCIWNASSSIPELFRASLNLRL